MTHSHFESPRVGVLIVDSRLRLLHCNAEGASILAYPRKPHQTQSPGLPTSLRKLTNRSGLASPEAIEFVSGRRRYLCRSFLLDLRCRTQEENDPIVVVLLERAQAEPLNITRWSDEFQLTVREREAVTYLLKGFSSREIAGVMNISPNTVKSFLKLVMAKVGASNRVGIVAKIFNRPA